jgi:hypothetical protein
VNRLAESSSKRSSRLSSSKRFERFDRSEAIERLEPTAGIGSSLLLFVARVFFRETVKKTQSKSIVVLEHDSWPMVRVPPDAALRLLFSTGRECLNMFFANPKLTLR